MREMRRVEEEMRKRERIEAERKEREKLLSEQQAEEERKALEECERYVLICHILFLLRDIPRRKVGCKDGSASAYLLDNFQALLGSRRL